jgi:two-component system nitrate/nitrite response regulator NarL
MAKRQLFATTIIGQSRLLREGVARILRSAEFRILASVSCVDELPTKPQADCALFLIVHTGDDFDFVVEQIEFFRESSPEGRIAIVADRYRPDELISAFRAGASGYFVDVMTCDVFVRSLELVMMGETVLPPAFLSYVLGPEEDHLDDEIHPDDHDDMIFLPEADVMAPQLSPREKITLRCLIEGDSNKSIARKMDITEATVKVHVKAILRKIRVHNRTQAAIWGINNVWTRQTSSTITPSLPAGLTKHTSAAMVSESAVEQSHASASSDVVVQTNHSEVSRIERLIRKEAHPRAAVMSRGRK